MKKVLVLISALFLVTFFSCQNNNHKKTVSPICDCKLDSVISTEIKDNNCVRGAIIEEYIIHPENVMLKTKGFDGWMHWSPEDWVWDFDKYYYKIEK